MRKLEEGGVGPDVEAEGGSGICRIKVAESICRQ